MADERILSDKNAVLSEEQRKQIKKELKNAESGMKESVRRLYRSVAVTKCSESGSARTTHRVKYRGQYPTPTTGRGHQHGLLKHRGSTKNRPDLQTNFFTVKIRPGGPRVQTGKRHVPESRNWITEFYHEGVRYKKALGSGISKTVAKEREAKFKQEVRRSDISGIWWSLHYIPE